VVAAPQGPLCGRGPDHGHPPCLDERPVHGLQSGGEGLPPVLGIHTGQGKNTYSDRGVAAMFEAHLKELDAPFHEAPDKVGWFLTTSVSAKLWLEEKSSALVAV
jgi:hypothetical protein